jgi:hypothetical protein
MGYTTVFSTSSVVRRWSNGCRSWSGMVVDVRGEHEARGGEGRRDRSNNAQLFVRHGNKMLIRRRNTWSWLPTPRSRRVLSSTAVQPRPPAKQHAPPPPYNSLVQVHRSPRTFVRSSACLSRVHLVVVHPKPCSRPRKPPMDNQASRYIMQSIPPFRCAFLALSYVAKKSKFYERCTNAWSAA